MVFMATKAAATAGTCGSPDTAIPSDLDSPCMWLMLASAVQEPDQHGVHIDSFEYPLLEPAGERGMAPGSRWDPTLGVVEYKGWSWGHGNMHGFTYQAQAVHRCMAAGLTGCPQFSSRRRSRCTSA